jgi:hypothetical protein
VQNLVKVAAPAGRVFKWIAQRFWKAYLAFADLQAFKPPKVYPKNSQANGLAGECHLFSMGK